MAKSFYSLTGCGRPTAQDGRALKRSQSMSSQFQAVRFDAQNLDYYVGKKGNETKILNNVNCSFRPGQATAIMGSSGAGKTTLMNVLAGRVGGRVEGTVLLNGELMTDMSYIIKSLSNCIPQEDTLMFTLTPREALRYTAELRLPEEMPRAAVNDRVEKVMVQLSLLKCADVKIGDVHNRGISGG